jgi:UDP-glucose 4-epimerase
VSDTAFAGKRVLITGGLGFIGSHLAARLVAADAKVTVVDSLIPEYGGNLANVRGIEDRIDINIADVRDKHAMNHHIRGKDVLFNLAGQTGHLDSMTEPEVDLEINCRAQLSILEACRRHNSDVKIVFASTRQLYGKPDYLPVDENHPARPVDVNGINKLAGELYHLLYNRVHGIRASAIRLTNTYGPHMRIKDARQTFLGVWIRRVVADETFEVWGGEQLRDFTYVDDAVEAFMLAASSDDANGRVFNLGGLEVVSLTELAEMLVGVAGSGSYESKTFPAERRAIDIGDYYADDKLIRGMLGWAPSVKLADGLARSVAYYRETLGDYV